MRLLMISQDFPPETGGIQTYSASHARHLAEWCEWFGVVAPDAAGHRHHDEALPYPVFRIPAANELLVFPLLFHLPYLLERHRIDAVYHTQWQTVPASLLARKRGWQGRVLGAAHLRELLFNPYRWIPFVSGLFVSYRQNVLLRVDHFYPVSSYTAEQLRQYGVPEQNMSVVTNGTDPEQFFPEPDITLKESLGLSDRRVLLTITRLVARKGIELVLESVSRLADEIPDLHYLVVGDGEQREDLERRAAMLGLENRVTFFGEVEHDRAKRYYSMADLFVMPCRSVGSDVEGAGIVFLEASACGLPVIGSDSGGISSVVRDGETGYLVPEDDLDALTGRIRELLLDRELSMRMGKQGRKRIVEESNWEQCSRMLFGNIRRQIDM